MSTFEKRNLKYENYWGRYFQHRCFLSTYPSAGLSESRKSPRVDVSGLLFGVYVSQSGSYVRLDMYLAFPG